MIQTVGAKVAFQESLTRILKPGGGFQINNKIEIKQSDYQQFWDLLMTPENATQFMIELIKIIDQTEFNKKTKNYNLENLLCTLLTVSMFKKVDVEKRKRELTDAKNQWDHHISINSINIKKTMANPYSVSIIYYLMQLLMENDENTFIGYIIGSITFLHDLYKIAKPENIEANYDIMKSHYTLMETYTRSVRVKSDQFFNVLLDDRFDLTETGEYMFCYEYILRNIRSKHRNVPRIIYDAITKYLKMIPFIAQDFPEQAEKSVLALLHMTKQFITYFSCEIPEVLKTLLHQIEIFRRWPFPVGVMASELVQILFQECKSRCSAFRIKLREDIPDIDFLEQAKVQSLNSDQLSNIQFSQNTEDRPNRNILQVFTFFDERHNDAYNVLMYQNTVRQELSTWYSKVYSPHALRTYLVAQILSLDNKNKMTIDKQTILAGFTDQEVFQLYCKLLVILEKCDQLDSLLDISMIQDNAFEEIMKEFINKPKQELNVLQTEINHVFGENVLKIPEYPMFFLENIIEKPSITIKQSIRLDGSVQHNASSIMIRRFIQQAYDNYLPLHTEPLRILIVGGDLELSKVCFILGEIYTLNPMHLRTLDIRIYLVPSKECALAQFLAVKDPWYQRYLYLPFMEDIMIPKIDHIKDDVQKVKEQPLLSQERVSSCNQLPLDLKSSVLNTYLREANRAYNVRVYEMKIWQINPNSQLASQGVKQEQGYDPVLGKEGFVISTVFFCSYVMLGACAEFELSKERQKEDKIQKMTFYDYKEKNLCKYQYMNVQMTTESTDMLGNITVDDPVNVQLHYCKINNVYTDFFEGNMPMPHTDWLELSYISYENSKVFDNSLKQKNIFKKHSKENIQNAFMSLFTNVSITKLLIDETTKKPFTVVADGRTYQDVLKIEISTTQMKKEPINGKPNNPTDLTSIKNLNLPIMSFLPFKV